MIKGLCSPGIHLAEIGDKSSSCNNLILKCDSNMYPFKVRTWKLGGNDIKSVVVKSNTVDLEKN